MLLRINLTTGEIKKQQIENALVNSYIGGRGLNARFLYDELKPGTDPLGPENIIIFGGGAFAGTSVPGSQRFNVTAKSPLTGFFGDSNSGGDLGAALRYAGYDMLVLDGQSARPVYVYINDEYVELKDASHIWGKTTSEARRAIERETGDPEICLALIGPAGENLVRFACILSEQSRAAGRTGMGAVLGSKRVKAVAVKGSHGIKVSDYRMLKELNEENYRLWRSDAGAYQRWTSYGPAAAWKAYQVTGMLPTRNFQSGIFPADMFGQMVENKYLVKQKACISCPLGCNHSYIVKTGPYIRSYGEALELDQLADFGPKVGNEDMSLDLKASMLCNEYGVDLMDMSAMISFVMECYEKGILSANDLGGLKPDWGSPEALLNLIKMTSYQENIGAVLSQGLKKTVEVFGKGSEKYAMHVKGMTLVMRNVRVSKGWALMYATSSRGACHMRAWLPEGYGAGGAVAPGIWDPGALKTVAQYSDPLNSLKEEGKAELTKWYEDLRAVRDSLEICHFSLYKVSVDTRGESSADLYARYIKAVTGRDISGTEVMLTGERISNLERAFNVREGLCRKDDNLPDRMLKEPMPDGPGAGHTVNLEPMIDRYYEIRGWDRVSGIPTDEKLREIDLGGVVEDMVKYR